MYACVQNKQICKYMNIYTFPCFEQGRQTLRGKRRHTGFSPPGRLRAGGGHEEGGPPHEEGGTGAAQDPEVEGPDP